MSKHIPINPGERFGRLTVLNRAGINSEGHATYRCRCDCGCVVSAADNIQLRKGKTTSCGCSHKETAARRLTIIHANRRGAASLYYRNRGVEDIAEDFDDMLGRE